MAATTARGAGAAAGRHLPPALPSPAAGHNRLAAHRRPHWGSVAPEAAALAAARAPQQQHLQQTPHQGLMAQTCTTATTVSSITCRRSVSDATAQQQSMYCGALGSGNPPVLAPAGLTLQQTHVADPATTTSCHQQQQQQQRTPLHGGLEASELLSAAAAQRSAAARDCCSCGDTAA